MALADNCNSLHTNAYDEAITTPTEESVRRALAIQLINSLEFGVLKNENPWQGSHFIEWLTDEVEPVTGAGTLLPLPFLRLSYAVEYGAAAASRARRAGRSRESDSDRSGTASRDAGTCR